MSLNYILKYKIQTLSFEIEGHSISLPGWVRYPLKISTVDFICFNPSRLFKFNENLLLVKHVLYKSKVNIQKKRKKKDVSVSLGFSKKSKWL